MTGRKKSSALSRNTTRFAIVSAGLLALGGVMSAGHAEGEQASAAMDAPVAAHAAQMFTPSAEAQFEEAFDHLDTASADPVLPAYAVDITEIEPARPALRRMGRGVASYYGRRFAGRPTANGETFDPAQLTAAHKTLPFGSRVRVTNPRNGRSVVVRINDRGPYAHGREIDLSRSAAEEIGLIAAGHGTVELDLLEG